jgi:hypothetical protein
VPLEYIADALGVSVEDLRIMTHGDVRWGLGRRLAQYGLAKYEVALRPGQTTRTAAGATATQTSFGEPRCACGNPAVDEAIDNRDRCSGGAAAYETRPSRAV